MASVEGFASPRFRRLPAHQRHQREGDLAAQADEAVRRGEVTRVFAHRPAKEAHGQNDLREHEEPERQGAHGGSRRKARGSSEAGDDLAASPPGDGQHDGKLEQDRPELAEARREEERAQCAEREPCGKHDSEIRSGGAKDWGGGHGRA